MDNKKHLEDWQIQELLIDYFIKLVHKIGGNIIKSDYIDTDLGFMICVELTEYSLPDFVEYTQIFGK